MKYMSHIEDVSHHENRKWTKKVIIKKKGEKLWNKTLFI